MNCTGTGVGTAEFFLAANGPSGTGPKTVNSGEKSVEITSAPVPVLPGPFSLSASCTAANSSTNQVNLGWSNSLNATSYRVERRAWSNGSWSQAGTTSGTSFSENLRSDTDFYYRVYALNNSGQQVSEPVEILGCGAVTSDPLPSPTADIKANGSNGPITIGYNTAATISWTSSNASNCTVSPTGWSGPSGSQSSGNLTSSQTYSLSCTGSGGSASDSVQVSVDGQPAAQPLPTVTLSASPNPIPYNTSSVLNWTSANATSCTASGAWSGSRSTSDSQSTGNLTASQTYILTCYNSSGSASASVVVTVNADTPPPPPPGPDPDTGTITIVSKEVNTDNPVYTNWTLYYNGAVANQETNIVSKTYSGKPVGQYDLRVLLEGSTHVFDHFDISPVNQYLSKNATLSYTIWYRPKPDMPPPPPGSSSVDLQCSPTVIPYNTSATVSWSSFKVSSCTVSPTGWTGTSDSRSTGNLTSSITYTISCTP